MRWVIVFILLIGVTPIFGQSSNERTQKLQKNYQSGNNYRTPYNRPPVVRPPVVRPPVVRPPVVRPPITPYYINPLPNYYWDDWRFGGWNRPQINNYYYGTTPIYRGGGGNTSIGATPTYKTPKTELKNTLGISFPINPNYEPAIGVYYSVGSEDVFITHCKFPLITFDYYDNITLWEVMNWGDMYLKTDKTFFEFTIGYGKKIKYITPYAGVGFVTIKEYPQYFDEYYILGTMGRYNILGDVETRPQLTTGIMLNKGYFNANLGVSFVGVPNVSIGGGFNF